MSNKLSELYLYRLIPGAKNPLRWNMKFRNRNNAASTPPSIPPSIPPPPVEPSNNDELSVEPSNNDGPFVSGLLLITQFEGFSAKAYADPLTGEKQITIGFGSTKNQNGDEWQLGDTITRTLAEKLLKNQLEEDYLPHLLKIPYWKDMTPVKQGALLSFSYNLGNRFYGSPDFETITQVLNKREWDKVPNTFYIYRNPGTKVELGLARRRAAEGVAWQNDTINEEEIMKIKTENLSYLNKMHNIS